MKQLADKLNGREYGEEVTIELEQEARDKNLVIVFGASDDLMELRGAINDEFGCYDGGEIHLDEQGVMINECRDGDCPYFIERKQSAKIIEAIWDEDGYSWLYKTSIPHETFEILEDGEKYCRGIVFSMESLKDEDKLKPITKGEQHES